MLLHEAREEARRVVDVGRVVCADALARDAPAFHRELGIDTKVHVGAFEELLDPWQLVLQCALPHLQVEEQQRLPTLRPTVDAFDHRAVVTRTVLPARAGLRIGHEHDQVERGLCGVVRIDSIPCCDLRIELAQHVFGGKLAENAHALRKRVAVEGYDAPRWQNGPWQRRRPFHRPQRVQVAADIAEGWVSIAGLGSEPTRGSTARHVLHRAAVRCARSRARQSAAGAKGRRIHHGRAPRRGEGVDGVDGHTLSCLADCSGYALRGRGRGTRRLRAICARGEQWGTEAAKQRAESDEFSYESVGQHVCTKRVRARADNGKMNGVRESRTEGLPNGLQRLRIPNGD